MRRRRLTGALVLVLLTSGCAVAQRANGTAPAPALPTAVIPTAIAPPQAEGLDGTSGAPGPQVCTAITRALTVRLKKPVTAKPNAWNDGGLPSMDLCTLLVQGHAVTIGVSALPSRPDSIVRLMNGAARVESLPELGPEALIGESRLVFHAGGRAVRVTPAGGIDLGTADGIDRDTAVAIAEAARDAVPHNLRPERQADATCQLSNSAAERFLRRPVQLRRDYREKGGALTCIWGTSDATVSIVEAFDQRTIPEAEQVPPPQFAPLGQPGYYLPKSGELVFRQGRRVVRVTALTDPPQEVTLDTLTHLVDPMLPLFLRCPGPSCCGPVNFVDQTGIQSSTITFGGWSSWSRGPGTAVCCRPELSSWECWRPGRRQHNPAARREAAAHRANAGSISVR